MRLQGFDLNQLLCLEALLEECNVTRAAERVHLSQSTMSASLEKLRTHFGDPLLTRSGRKLVPTSFAKSLIGPLGELLARTRGFAALSPENSVANTDRLLKVIASDYSLAAFLGAAIKRSQQVMPGLRFDVLPLSAASPQLLASGEIDLLFAGEAFDVGRTPNIGLFEDEFVCLTCINGDPETTSLSRQAFMDRQHVVVRYFENQMRFYDEIALRREGLKRAHTVSVWSYVSVPHLIQGTKLVATVTARMAERICERWPIKTHPFPFEHQPMRMQAYWHPSRDEDPMVSRFLALAKSVCDEEKA
ncbi:MAG: LysR family transcriptional regulator [Pseudomonadota bacterium]